MRLICSKLRFETDRQLSLFPATCAALKASELDLVKALDGLVETGWSEEAKECASGALLQLCPERKKAVVVEVDPDARHIMLSCEARPPPSTEGVSCCCCCCDLS